MFFSSICLNIISKSYRRANQKLVKDFATLGVNSSTLFTTSNKYCLSNMSTENHNNGDDTKSVKIGTHSGTFHCDEILACYMLHQLDNFKDAEIVRSRDSDVLKTCNIVVDVGSEFDPSKNLFDHHQKTFNETFSSLKPEFGDKYNIRLSSAGLIYTYFGEQVLQNILKKEKGLTLPQDSLKALYEQVYKSFIREIDAIDNGVQICDGEPKYSISTHLSSRVGNFNPSWNSDKEIDEMVQFEKAKKLVGEEFVDKIIYFATSWLPARDIVKAAILNSKSVHSSGQIIELDDFCPWKEHLFNLETELNIEGRFRYVLFCGDKKNDWRVMAVPNQPNSFICRKFLHKDWRGLRTEIIKLSGIEDAKFCHASGFIGGAGSRNGVFKMAVQSLAGPED